MGVTIHKAIFTNAYLWLSHRVVPISKPCPMMFSALWTVVYIGLFLFGGALGEEFVGEKNCMLR